jgi:DNA-binding MarR family transcriptional regulator
MSHPTVDLDDVVHQRARLGILAILSRGDRVEFGYLKDVLDLSPGNLSRHLTTLIEARLVTVEKGYQGRRPRTWVSITKTGRRAYDDEMTILRSLLALQDAPHGEDLVTPGAEDPDPSSQPPPGRTMNQPALP